jgi:hypothetical protein
MMNSEIGTTNWWKKLQAEQAARKLHRKQTREQVGPELKAWCDAQHAMGALYLEWDGGNDSGSAQLCREMGPDGEPYCYERSGSNPEDAADTQDAEYSEMIVRAAYDALDYGSWAGEFQANGKAYYDPETGVFSGTDHYAADEYHRVDDAGITLEIPQAVAFDEVELLFDSESEGEDAELQVNFHMRHGFIGDEHLKAIAQLQADFCTQLEAVIKRELAKPYTPPQVSEGMLYFYEICSREELKRDNAQDLLVVKRSMISFSIRNTIPREIVVEILPGTDLVSGER